ncbi:hypothetical protein MMC08_003329 [Hypocenomyce scalaris]|nr:hypothetical protein [Hypocenomyce scalaris]
MDAFTPQQTTELVSRIGCKKAHMRLDKLWWNSFMTGPLLGFGCAVALSTETAPWYQTNAPGLIRTLGALLFPIGLVMIVLSGADLFTSNIMFMTTAFLHRRISIIDVLKNWTISFLGNLGGMLFFTLIIIGYGGVFEMEPYKTESINFATMKAVDPAWYQILLRGIGANWLVSFAVYISISSREIHSTISAIWFPTATFVALGLDHCIANMFFIPIGIWNGAPGISVGYYIWKSLIPATIGNMIGGGLFVGAVYWYLYLTGEGSVEVNFNTGGLESAMEAGGPMGHAGSHTRGQAGRGGSNGAVIEGRDPSAGEEGRERELPHSGGYMASGIGRELSAEMYGKRKGPPSEKERSPSV